MQQKYGCLLPLQVPDEGLSKVNLMQHVAQAEGKHQQLVATNQISTSTVSECSNSVLSMIV
jgi:hypothetical protein